MTRTIVTAALLAFALPAFAPASALAAPRADGERPVVLRLMSGHEVSGRILPEGFDEASGLVMRRDDNGGRLTLRWDQIHPDDVDAVKRMYGFVGDDLPPVLIDALEVETTSGQTYTGINRGWKDKKLQLEKAGVIYPVPESMVKRTRTVKVDALEYADPLEVFLQRQQETQPSRAVDWFNLALLAESLGLFGQAEECYATTLELEPEFSKKKVIETNLAQLEIKKKESDATAFLQRINAMLIQGKFDDALAGTDEFVQTWPASQQMGELQRLKNRIIEKRHDTLVSRCRTDFFSFLRDTVRQKARDRELELGAAMTWAEEEVYQEVIDKLAAYYKTEVDEVEKVWGERGTGGSPHTSSYAGGTFILGGAARDGLVEEEEAGDGGGPGTQPGANANNNIAAKIAAALAAQQKKRAQAKKQGQAQQIYDVPPSPEEWWLAAAPTERQGFLIAWFGEKGGHTEVVGIDGRACSTCEGKGIHEFWGGNLSSGDPTEKKQTWEPCARCKGLGFDRIVKIR